jgi:hypothetical protein
MPQRPLLEPIREVGIHEQRFERVKRRSMILIMPRREGCDGSGVALEIAHEAAVSAEPCQRPLDNPSLGYDDKLAQLVALDDLDCPGAGVGGSQSDTGSLVSGIGEDAKDERKQRARSFVQQQRRAVAVLNISGMNRDAQQQAERIDEDVALAAGDLLGRVKALCIEEGPPFGAALALWLSMIAAVGLASLPSFSRVAT